MKDLIGTLIGTYSDVEIVSQLLDILDYLQHPCPTPHTCIVYSLVLIHQTFTRFIRQCSA